MQKATPRSHQTHSKNLILIYVFPSSNLFGPNSLLPPYVAVWASAQKKETSHLTTKEYQNDMMPTDKSFEEKAFELSEPGYFPT